MSELWRPVVGYEAAYEVSDHGRVRSVDRQVPHGRGGGSRFRRGQLLRPGPTSTGHLTVALGKGNSRLVHHLVLEAFVGPRPPKPFEGLHFDDCPANNHLSNLRWGTRSANLHDAVRNGRKAIGALHQGAKLQESDAAAIMGLRSVRRDRSGYHPSGLARLYGVSESTIRQCQHRRAWRHVQPLSTADAIAWLQDFGPAGAVYAQMDYERRNLAFGPLPLDEQWLASRELERRRTA